MEDITRMELARVALKLPLEIDRKEEFSPTLSMWLSKGEVFVNLLIMMYIWLITIFNFYLLTYVMTSFDQIFLSVLAA